MTEFIHNVFTTIFNDNVILATILIAMVPIIELRGAIPFATNPGFWGDLALNNWSAFGWSLLGSCLIVPIIALLFLPLINWLKRTKAFSKFANWLENRIKTKSSSITDADANQPDNKSKKSCWKKMLGVFIFVAVPLPFTGVWTGSCIAVFLGLNFWKTCLSVITGNIVAGILITLILQFFPWLNNWLFYIFIVIIFVILIVELIKILINKKKSRNNSAN